MSVKSRNKNKHSDDFRNNRENIEEDFNLNENTKIFKKKTTPEFEDTQSEFGFRDKDDRSISNFSVQLRKPQKFS